jgi:hypothetical protein
MRVLCFALIVSAAALGAAPSPLPAPARDADMARAEAALAQLPLRFEANAGQWDPAIRYAAHAGGYKLVFTAEGAMVSLPDAKPINITLPGSNRNARLEPVDRLPVRTDYYLGSRDRWRASVPTYARLRVANAYPGIDLVYYGNQRTLEYDFVLRPGADPSAIRMHFKGARDLRINSDGDLVIDSGSGSLVQQKPVIYQEDARTSERRKIDGNFVLLAGGEVGVQVARYDRSRPLVIDPTLIYSAAIGGKGTDQVDAVKFHKSGKLYILGHTYTGDLSATDARYADGNASPGTSDIFLAILNTQAANLPLVYFTYFGGKNDDFPAAMDLASDGRVFFTGTTTSSDYPLFAGTIQDKAIGAELGVAYNAFMTELDPSAAGTDALWYSTYLGGNGRDYGVGIAVDPSDNVYLIGTTTSDDFPVTETAYGPILWGDSDLFLCEINPNEGKLVYSTYLGGELADTARGLVYKNGLVYFAADTLSTQFPLAGAPYRLSNQGSQDIIIGAMDMTKSGEAGLVYCTYFGGSDVDQVRGIALDASGRVMITGFTASPNFPVSGDAVQRILGGATDAFVAVVDPSQPPFFLVYSSYLGGKRGEAGFGVAGDASGAIYVAGYTYSDNFPTSDGAPQMYSGNGCDVFVVKLKPGIPGLSGYEFATYLGDNKLHVPTGMAVGPDGTMYVAGYTTGGLPAVGSSPWPVYGGGLSDGFIFAISQQTTVGVPVRSQRSNRWAAPRSPFF